MAEYIERKAAIKAVEKNDCEGYATWAIKSVPIADVVERKHGKWKRRIVDNGFNADWKCSDCGYKVMSDFFDFNFCPNCGADMRGENDDT